MPGICGEGTCVNSVGGYTCNCKDGYAVDASGKCQGESRFICKFPLGPDHFLLLYRCPNITVLYSQHLCNKLVLSHTCLIRNNCNGSIYIFPRIEIQCFVLFTAKMLGDKAKGRLLERKCLIRENMVPMCHVLNTILFF